ncbi:MAG: hypothetical protein ACYCW6_12990 [Candidatus Xenobia bacterium]
MERFKSSGRNLMGRLFGGKEERPAAPGQLAVAEAQLKVLPREGRFIDFVSTLDDLLLFSVEGSLSGAPEIFREGTVVSVKIPIETGLGPSHVRLQTRQVPPPDGGSVERQQALSHRMEGGRRGLSFQFGWQDQELRYEFELIEPVTIQGFEERRQSGPVFRGAPPISQMAGFLRAITAQRRDWMQILEDLCRGVTSARVRATLPALRQHPGRVDPDEMAGRFVAMVRSVGHLVGEATVAALCVLTEMERGVVSAETLAAGGPAIEPTIVAVALVAHHLGLEAPANLWQDYFGEVPQAEPLAQPEAMAAVAVLRTSMQARTALMVLEDLARQSKSPRVQEFVEAQRPRTTTGILTGGALQRTVMAAIGAAGRSMRPSTLNAMCLFVDLEAGLMAPTDVREAGRPYDATLYSVMVVSEAFDIPLRGIRLLALQSDLVATMRALLAVLPCGAVMGAKGPDGLPTWRFIRSEQEALALLQARMELTGEVLGVWPTLDQVDENDLGAFIEAAGRVFVRFRSDVDGSCHWRRMSTAFLKSCVRSDHAEGSVGYVEDFHAYHFIRMVMAWEVAVTPEQLIGVGPVLAVYANDRGSRRYHLLPRVESADSLASPAPGLTWSGNVVSFPDMQAFPDRLDEVRPEQGQEATRTTLGLLAHILAALRHAIQDRDQRLPLHETRSLVVLVAEVLARGGAMFDPIPLPRLREMATWLRKDLPIVVSVHERLLRLCHTTSAGPELIALGLVPLCGEISSEMSLTTTQLATARARLRDRVLKLVASEDLNIRTAAVAALPYVFVGAPRDEVDELLPRLRGFMQDSSSTLRAAAAEAMTMVVLGGLLPVPPPIRILDPRRPASREPSKDAGQVLGNWLGEVANVVTNTFGLDEDDSRHITSMLRSLLAS